MDEADRAMQYQMNLNAEAARKRVDPLPPPTGRCLYCRDPVDPTHHFCDEDCRQDWDYERARARLWGRS